MTNVIDFSQKLNQLKQELKDRVTQIDSDLVAKKGGEVTRQDDHNYEVSREDVLLALKTEAEEELNLIDSALRRIKDGSYGVCASCGGEIEKNRLAAVPYANKCLQCARNSDN